MNRVGNVIWEGNVIVARWMKGAWYVLVRGEWDVAPVAMQHTYAAIPQARLKDPDLFAQRTRELDNLGVLRGTGRTRT